MDPLVTLRQGHFRGVRKNDVDCFHNVPYAQPFERFKNPQRVLDSDEEFSASTYGPSPPQGHQRLAFVSGDAPAAATQDEAHCGVLSVYTSGTIDGKQRPVLFWIHGGAWTVGASQWSQYDGTNIVKDSDVVCVCINYRLGAFGFLYDGQRSLDAGLDLPLGTADVVLALEWVRDNIHAFGGDPDNVTTIGQSAGAHHAQSLFDVRPDLFRRAILQSSPASSTNPPEQGKKVRQIFEANLPAGTTAQTASTDDILQAQAKAIAGMRGISMVPFMPTVSSVIGVKNTTAEKKQALVGWLSNDGLAFAKLSAPDTPTSQLDGVAWTDNLFRGSSRALVEKWRAIGHEVTAFELTWAPPGFELGATHNTDLPLLFGAEQWRSAPCVSEDHLDEWLVRGKRWRQAVGRFAKDGTTLQKQDGIEVWTA